MTTDSKPRVMTKLERIQLSMSFISPFLVFLFFIIAFVHIVRFDKNEFYPTYNLMKEHYSLFEKLDLKYDNQLNKDVSLDNLKLKQQDIQYYSDIYNSHSGFIKNQHMSDLTNMYHNYEIKLEEINRSARHEKYLSKIQYEDVMELLPTKLQMEKINDSLPKPFFLTFVKSVLIALILQFLIYNIIIQAFKILYKKQ